MHPFYVIIRKYNLIDMTCSFISAKLLITAVGQRGLDNSELNTQNERVKKTATKKID